MPLFFIDAFIKWLMREQIKRLELARTTGLVHRSWRVDGAPAQLVCHLPCWTWEVWSRRLFSLILALQSVETLDAL